MDQEIRVLEEQQDDNDHHQILMIAQRDELQRQVKEVKDQQKKNLEDHTEASNKLKEEVGIIEDDKDKEAKAIRTLELEYHKAVRHRKELDNRQPKEVRALKTAAKEKK